MQNSKSSVFKSLINSSIFKYIFAFLFFDILVFQLGIYNQIISPNSMAGMAFYFNKYENRRQSNPEKDILVLGDSKISEGFSASKAKSRSGDLNYGFVQGGIPGTTYRTWYFLLKSIDPDYSRYRAIVLTLPSYRKIPFDESLPESRGLDTEILAPILGASGFLELGYSFPSWKDKMNIWTLSLIKSTSYRADFQDLIHSPKTRLSSVKWRREEGERHLDNYQGRSESMQGLTVVPETNSITFPAHLNADERKSVEIRYTGLSKPGSDAFDEYSVKWLKRILQMYKNSKTKVIFLRCPTNPIPDQQNYPLARLSEFISQEIDNKLVIDEGYFADLESPEFFFDTFHMNKKGREIFTERLTDWIVKNI